MGYAKIYDELLDSSVWEEDYATRIVWTALLVMADRDGNVRARALGIAKRAGVKLEEAKKALAIFLAPDPNSKSTVAEGRRMVETSTGYLVINYEAYRDRMSDEERKEAGQERTRRWRERKEAKRLEAERVAAEIQGRDVTNVTVTRGDACDTSGSGSGSGSSSGSTQLQAPGLSANDCSRQGSETIQIQPADGEFGEFDPKVSWGMTREMWESAGKHPAETSFTPAKGVFDKRINAGNWAAFSQAVNWAVRESLARGERNWLGYLYTFIEEEKWKRQEPPINARTIDAVQTPTLNIDI